MEFMTQQPEILSSQTRYILLHSITIQEKGGKQREELFFRLNHQIMYSCCRHRPLPDDGSGACCCATLLLLLLLSDTLAEIEASSPPQNFSTFWLFYHHPYAWSDRYDGAGLLFVTALVEQPYLKEDMGKCSEGGNGGAKSATMPITKIYKKSYSKQTNFTVHSSCYLD